MDSASADKLRTNLSSAPCTSSTPKCNLHGDLLRAIRELRKDDSIVILPADKSNTIVMDRSDYDEKIESMLMDSNYRKTEEGAHNQSGGDRSGPRKRGTHIPNTTFLILSPALWLPRVHKDILPLRPIMSATDSPTYKLAKELAKVLSPLAG